MTDANPNPVDGPTEILIVTYHKDQLWLEYALKCIQKHCRGFQGVTVATPHPAMRGMVGPYIDEEFFERANGSGPVPVRVHYYDEIPRKGMLQHMIKLASPDEFLPEGTKYVLTCDADCMFKMPTTPEHYFWQDKPYCIIRSWESLITVDTRNPGAKVISNNMQWRGPTDAQLGFPSEVFGMCMNTVVFPMDFFPAYRAHIRAAHNRPFSDVILSGRNEFPQTSMDFTAMVAYAHKFMHERWFWFDTAHPPYPADRKQAYHSHTGYSPATGFKPEIQVEIESFLK